MSNEKEEIKKKKEELDKKHMERLQILQKSRESIGRQLTFDIDEGGLKAIDEIKQLIDSNIQDPKEKYELFYNGIQKVLRKFLPMGKDFEQERRIIHDEKLIFLNRGKARGYDGVRGSDSRMTYNEDLAEMAKLVSEWAVTSQDPVDLYQRLYDLNEKYNYGHQMYDETSLGFHNAMKKIAKAPKPND